MTNNRQQPMSPEMLHIVERGEEVKFSQYNAQNSLLAMYPKIVEALVGHQVVKEQMVVPEVINYTLQSESLIATEQIVNVSNFESVNRHNLLNEAHQLLDDVLEEMAA